MHRVVVTGLGAITPIGSHGEENWKSLMECKSGIGPITLFDASKYNTRIAGEVRNYQPENYFSVKERKRMDRFIQFFMIAGEESLKSSGLDVSKENPVKVGVCVGVGIGGLVEIQNQYNEILQRGPKRVTPFFIPMVISNLASGNFAIKHGLRGPNTCITTACASSAHAVGESYRLIQRGDVDVMFAGGAEAVICELGVAGFCAMRALSERNEAPERASRPFDKDRDGFVMGEGSAALVLESLEHAKARSAPILAELVGYGLNCDASHITQPSPDGDGAARCMKLALSDAKINPESVGYINAHGTSTPIGDVMETIAIKQVFGSHADKLCVSSTKSMTGHLLGAAGAVESMYCVQALVNEYVPPTLNLDDPSPECTLNYVPHEPQKRRLRYVLNNSFGFGGANASLIFKRFE